MNEAERTKLHILSLRIEAGDETMAGLRRALADMVETPQRPGAIFITTDQRERMQNSYGFNSLVHDITGI